MITEDYCSYKIAKLLKSKDFNDVYSKGDCTAYACTHQMAMKWLREVHKLHIEIDVYKDIKYAWSLSHVDSGEYVIDPLKLKDKGYPTYEEAVEAALKYCLTKVI